MSLVAVDETESAAGQVLMVGGDWVTWREMQLVDLATGTCTRQPNLLDGRVYSAAARLKDGRVVCAGGLPHYSMHSAEIYGPPAQGATDAPWTWTALPAMSEYRHACSGCVMGDGRFAVLGGASSVPSLSSCEALVLGDDDAPHWEPMPPMHEARRGSTCATVPGGIIVAGGEGLKSAEVYDEAMDRWFRLPHDLPGDAAELELAGSAIM